MKSSMRRVIENTIVRFLSVTPFIIFGVACSDDAAVTKKSPFPLVSGQVWGKGVTDVDNNSYATVVMNNREWMVGNLKTTKYNDGTPILNKTTSAEWSCSAVPAFCWLANNEITYKESLGASYNWYAVNTGNLCPAGWRVPSDTEWTEEALGTNERFSYLPGGMRDELGTFINLLDSSKYSNPYFWTSAGTSFRTNAEAGVVQSINGRYGLPVRCLKDSQQ
jgi:Fibrobacter succinogenes major domain (Fib_succ_major)